MWRDPTSWTARSRTGAMSTVTSSTHGGVNTHVVVQYGGGASRVVVVQIMGVI